MTVKYFDLKFCRPALIVIKISLNMENYIVIKCYAISPSLLMVPLWSVLENNS